MSESNSNSRQESSFDWQAARQRIAAVEAALVEMSETTPEVMEQIWARRAEQLARIPVEDDRGEQVALLVVRMGREVYGIDVQVVHDIRSAGRITPVPRVPDWVVGVVNLRGRILSAIDLTGYFGLARAKHNGNGDRDGAEGPYLVVVKAAEMEVALLVDEVVTVEMFPTSQVQSASDAIRGITPEYVNGVVSNRDGDSLLVALNLGAVLSDERLIIHEEIS